MTRLSTRAHGAIDYSIGVALLAAPLLLGFHTGGAAAWIPVGVGLALIGYSLVTEYELAVLRRLDMRIHLWLDGFAGLFLATSPWLFAFDRTVWLPHLLLGAVLAIVAVLSDTIPGYERRGAARVNA